MRRTMVICLGLLSTPAIADPATPSDEFAAKVIGHPLAAGENYACFFRTYDATHLRRHPSQNVTRAALLLHVDKDQTDAMSFSFAFQVRGSRKLQTGNADCGVHADENGHANVACMVPCDGGQTGLVEIDGPEKARIVLTRPGVSDVDSSHPDGPELDPINLHADDRVFDLTRAPASACKPLIARWR